MEIREHKLPFHLALAKAYVEDFTSIADLFDYNPFHISSYEKRWNQLKGVEKTCPRKKLVEALENYNRRIGNTKKAFEQMNRLKDPEAVVVIGGQQPGVLTGPLYSIYKILTILTIARQKEQELGIPVIPVFWIAGEDHDWDEVNHVYALTKEDSIRKHVLPSTIDGKVSISHNVVEADTLRTYIDTFFEVMPKTDHTPLLRDELHTIIAQSPTLSDFFARLIVSLFGDEGIILFDSADPIFRQLEGEMFARFIEDNETISNLLESESIQVQQRGYTPQVESYPENAHLFYYLNGERLPLERVEEGFRVRNSNQVWSKETLRNQALRHPEQFSCNVVTRPLMQEYLFPVLAFVGGPGEISYWGLYRKIFDHFGFTLPIIVPRISITISDAYTQKIAKKYNLTFLDMVTDLQNKKQEWLNRQQNYHYPEKFEQARREIASLYGSIIQSISNIEKGLHALGEKNLNRIIDQVNYLEMKTDLAFVNRHSVTLRQFDRIGSFLVPQDKPQERVFNVYQFINAYGRDWWQEFKTLPFVANPYHKEVCL